jgi:hypothetical protein
MKLSNRRADEQAMEIAIQLHNEFNQEKTVPRRIKGWQWDSYLYCSVTYKGAYAAKYPVRYWAYSDDPNAFTIEVRHFRENHLYIHGGINKKLQKQYRRGDF